MKTPTLNEYYSLMPELISHKQYSEWQEKRSKYVRDPLNPQFRSEDVLRNIADNEVIIEFDFSKKQKHPELIPAARTESNQWITKIQERLTHYYIKTDHGGISPHLRFIYPGLELFPHNIRKEYKLKIAQDILELIDFKSEHLTLDKSLLTARFKSISLEGRPHFKPEWKGAIEEYTIYNTEFPNLNPKVTHALIKAQTIIKQEPITPIDYGDIHKDKLMNWLKQYYKEGKRNNITLAYSGICKKSNIKLVQSQELFTHFLTNIYMDTSCIKQSMKEISYSYKKENDNIAVWDFIKRSFNEDNMDEAFDCNKQLKVCFTKNNIDDIKVWQGDDLWTADIPPLKWIIPDFMLENGYGFIAGKPGHGKTWITLSACKSLITGTPFMNRPVDRPYKVLFIDEESRIQRLKSRFMKGFGGLSKEHRNNMFFVSNNNLSFTPEGFEKIKKLIISTGAEIVFFDSFARGFKGKENEADDVSALFDDLIRPLLTETRVCFNWIHHYSKSDSNNGGYQLRGSSDLTGQCDIIWQVKKKNNDVYEIKQTKSRDNRSVDPVECKFVDGEGGTLDVVYLGDRIVNNKGLGEKRQDKIWNILLEEFGTNKMFIKDMLTSVKARIDLSDISVKKYLKELCDDGRLEKVKNGLYKFPKKELDVDVEEKDET